MDNWKIVNGNVHKNKGKLKFNWKKINYNIVIAGCGQTMEEAKIDKQQETQTETLKRCAEKNLNEDKQQTGVTEITFLCHRITKDVEKVNKAKV